MKFPLEPIARLPDHSVLEYGFFICCFTCVTYPGVLSLQKQKGKKAVDVLKMADEWGVKLLTLEQLMAQLKKYKPLPKPEEDDEDDPDKKHHKGVCVEGGREGGGGMYDSCEDEEVCSLP